MDKSLRILAAYEVASGIVALAFTLGVSALPGGGAITFNAPAAALSLLSVGAGVALWNGWRRSLGASLVLQGAQLLQVQIGHVMLGLAIGAEVLALFHAAGMNFFATAGLIAGAWWSPERVPTVISVNLLAVVAFLWLWQYRGPSTSPADESLALPGELGSAAPRAPRDELARSSDQSLGADTAP